jgi:DNA mismatch endonuclease (patch repair protein)
MPSDNRDYWAAKIQRNMERDRRVNRELRRMGFVPMRIWEHDLKSSESLRRVERRLKRRLRNVFR